MTIAITVNGKLRQLDDRLSVVELISDMELTGKRIAVEVNGEIVPASMHDRHLLAAGDKVEIVGAIGGG
jgi:sulfur carrier protein